MYSPKRNIYINLEVYEKGVMYPSLPKGFEHEFVEVKQEVKEIKEVKKTRKRNAR